MINIYTLLYIRQINKDLLYSTGNSIQYLIVTNNGKESEKEYIYIYILMCIIDSLCCTPKTNTTLEMNLFQYKLKK